MTYKELLYKLAEKEGFDANYSMKHLNVEECFSSRLAWEKEWEDVADVESLKLL